MNPIEAIIVWCVIGYTHFQLVKHEYSTNIDFVWSIVLGPIGVMINGFFWLVTSDWSNRKYK